MSKRVGWLAVTVFSLALVSAGCRKNEDLTRAIDGGVGRSISSQPAPAAFQWKSLGALQPDNDTLLRQPVSACWLGEHLAVADEHRQRVVVFDAAGVPVRTIGKRGVKEGEFLEISTIRCSEGRAALLVADGGSRRVSFFDAAGRLLYSVPAPVTPQDPVQLGDFILTSSGDWFDSWLGIRANDGPYLSAEDWRKVKLVRAWSPVGDTRGEFGDPVAYSHPTARRVLNRVFLASVRDTVWLLTQGDAVLRGFGADGGSV
ncbi:MAG TPA: 6-bladed beta-propeller, partial [Longimicrobium sp.]|nr:6-bladed beta-propeller [Longimicrobium sp.]